MVLPPYETGPAPAPPSAPDHSVCEVGTGIEDWRVPLVLPSPAGPKLIWNREQWGPLHHALLVVCP